MSEIACSAVYRSHKLPACELKSRQAGSLWLRQIGKLFFEHCLLARPVEALAQVLAQGAQRGRPTRRGTAVARACRDEAGAIGGRMAKRCTLTITITITFTITFTLS